MGEKAPRSAGSPGSPRRGLAGRSRRGARGRWRSLGLLAASLALSVGLLETGLWLAHAVLGGKPRLLVADAELGWKNRRNFAGRRALNDGSRWELQLDDRGRRAPGFAPPDPAPRLVALGDSFVFGDGVDTEAQFLHRVAKDLPAEVTNLGVVGYSTDQELLALRRYEGRCDLLLLGSYLSNDLAGNLSHSGGPLLRFKPKFVDTEGALELAPVSHPWLNAARHRSYLVTLGLAAAHRLDPELGLFDPPPADADAWGRFLDLVDAILDEAGRCGARRTVLLVWTARSAGPAPDGVPGLAGRYAGRGVAVIDLDRIVRERGLDPKSLYHALDVDPGGHWTAAGHALVAEVLLEALAGGSTGEGLAGPVDQSSR